MIVRGTILPKDMILSGPSPGGCQKQRVAAAKLWLDAAEKAGLRPRMVQQSLASEGLPANGILLSLQITDRQLGLPPWPMSFGMKSF